MKTKYHRAFLENHRDEYDDMLAAQNGCCALCFSKPKTRKLAMDHNHKDMTLRGLLCSRCNRNLPYWITPQWLLRAVDYLKKS